MNCDDFSEWLQVQLDERTDIVLPSEMMEHLNHCDSCRAQVDAWNRIASVMPNDSATIVTPGAESYPIKIVATAIASVAAVFLIAFLMGRDDSSSVDSPQTVVMATNMESSPVSEISDTALYDDKVNPAFIWKQLQSRDWISETMPTVQSVRDGMAPLGRSFSSAVNILTMGNRDRPS